MIKSLSQRFFIRRRRSPTANFWHRVPIASNDSRYRFQYHSRSLQLHSPEIGVAPPPIFTNPFRSGVYYRSVLEVAPTDKNAVPMPQGQDLKPTPIFANTFRSGVSSRSVFKAAPTDPKPVPMPQWQESKPTPTDTKPVPMPQWQKSKVWNKIFNPYFDLKRYEPTPDDNNYVPLWDIAPGCILFLPHGHRLAPKSIEEISKYGSVEMCGHHVVVLAVDIKGVDEATIGVATIRSYSQHRDMCRFLGMDWFDTTHFVIEQRGINGLPRLDEFNIKMLRLYKTPMSNIQKNKRQFVAADRILTVPYQELMTEVKFKPERAWWPSCALDGWTRRVIKEDFKQICDIIGFTPDPWVTSGPYMWKDFVRKTGINTFGFDLEDPALYDEKAFFRQMWKEGEEKFDENTSKRLKVDLRSTFDDSPLGWSSDRFPYKSNKQDTLVRRWTVPSKDDINLIHQ
ncbi:hypothetical protein SBOR_7836 [Sclerotinia borealis F-4128]|uniref:Uncharacterized protein n=1 Tax=Sclerotinia borealis (strain F-4128) TaxID=1432307 RepID=W9CB59_SCLBF|nr:hypothetical protein SBOR_7836 [Sclerotinia borealis F-4128]